jgi:hypothetical protein
MQYPTTYSWYLKETQNHHKIQLVVFLKSQHLSCVKKNVFTRRTALFRHKNKNSNNPSSFYNVAAGIFRANARLPTGTSPWCLGFFRLVLPETKTTRAPPLRICRVMIKKETHHNETNEPSWNATRCGRTKIHSSR